MDRLNAGISLANNWEDFSASIEKGGFVYAYWDGSAETEQKIKELTAATTRCSPFDAPIEDIGSKKCVLTGADTEHRALFAKAY